MTPWSYGLAAVADDLPYRANFDPNDKSNDDKLPTENQYFPWFEKYRCQTCDDEDGLDFNSTHEEHIESRRFLIYRLPFMKTVKGKRSCPECVAAEAGKDFFKASSSLITKTDAMKTYKLKKDEIESLEVAKVISGKYGPTKLYERSECRELGEAKERDKAAKKQEKEAEKERKKSAKAGKNKKNGGDGSAPSKMSRKRGRKSSEESEEGEESDAEIGGLEKDTEETPGNTRNGRKRQKLNYEEPETADEDDVKIGNSKAPSSPHFISGSPKAIEKAEPGEVAQADTPGSDRAIPRSRGRPRKALASQSDSPVPKPVSRGRDYPKKSSA